MSLRVAYLVNNYPSVSHTFIRREIHALERQGVSVQRVAIRGWDLPLVDEADRQERALTRYILKDGMFRLVRAVLRAALGTPAKLFSTACLAMRMAKGSDRSLPVHLAYLAEACVVVQWLADSNTEHLHAHFATNPAEVAMLVSALGGPRYSFTAHGSDIMDRPAQMGLNEKVGRAAFVVAVCSFGRSQIFRWVPYELWNRVTVVRCGLEQGYGDDALPLVNRAARLVCVGRLSKEKGQLLLVEAAFQIVASGRAIEIVLAGDGPMRFEVEALVARKGLEAHIRITGWLDSQAVRNELQQARAVVVPSLSEGLPVAIMEAMAHHLPVIAPYLAGIPELVTHGETGWLFPAGDVAALTEAIQACLDTPPLAMVTMGKAAHREVWMAHDVDVEACKLAALFTQSSGEATTRRPSPLV
jgi:colanic acid/amylovoran biosynthesis glycosyltransferase